MAGGTGTRFWPLSRKDNPKQCLNIIDEKKTMIEATIDRFKPLISENKIFISTGKEVEAAIKKVLDNQYRYIVEPIRRNTAAAIALSVIWTKNELEANENEVIAFVGSDYYIKEKDIFQNTLKEAERLARQGYIVTIGIPPRYPATGYGYILRGNKIDTTYSNAYEVKKFKEKPNRKIAEHYIQDGSYFWNSGMFVASIKTLIREFRLHSPKHIKMLQNAKKSNFSTEALQKAFENMPSISFDYAIMEKTDKAATIAGNFYWDDVGSWQALKKLLPSDDNNNTQRNADTLLIDTKNTLIVDTTDKKPLISLIGVDSMVVVNTEDAILICPQEKSQEVRELVERLKKQKQDLL